jgi:hypothetical protein
LRRIPPTTWLAVAVLALALGRSLAADDAPLDEPELADLVECGLREDVEGEGLVAWDDTQTGRAETRDGWLWLQAPERFLDPFDTEGTVLLDGGRLSARVNLVPWGATLLSPLRCENSVVFERSDRIDFRVEGVGDARVRLRACDQLLDVVDGRATLWVPPSRLAEGCDARLVIGKDVSTRDLRKLTASDAGAVLTIDATSFWTDVE